MIGYRNRGDTLTGLTLVETDGTVTISGGKILMSGKSGAEAATLGFYKSMGTLAVGAKFYWQMMYTVENMFNVCSVMTYAVLSDPGGYDGNAIRTGFNRDNFNAMYSNSIAGGATHTNSGNDTSDYNVVHDLQMHYTNSDAQIDFFHRISDDAGDLDPTSATAWTEWAAGSRYSAGNNMIGDTVYLAMSKWGVAGNLEIDDIYYLTDGTFTPPAPTISSVDVISSTELEVSWSEGSISAINADYVSLERSTVGSGSGFSEIYQAPLLTDAYDDTTLSPGTLYYYRLRAVVVVGGVTYYSTYSSEMSATTDAAVSTNTGAGSSAMNIRFLRRRK
jgi:hypothetical protein